MKTYTVTFARIGRSHDVAPLTTEAADADALAAKIYRYARPYLRSRDVEVCVDLSLSKGDIFCGFQSGGSFTVTEGQLPTVIDPATGQLNPAYVAEQAGESR